MSLQLVLLGCFVSAFATSLGALPALGVDRLSPKMNNILLSFSAGIMLAAAGFSLLLPSLDLATLQFGSTVQGAILTGCFLLVGGWFLLACNRRIPHEHFFKGREGGSSSRVQRIWLFVVAIALHNFPEGLAVGGGVGSQSLEIALPIITGIGLQDIPEGFIVAAALVSVGYSKLTAFGVATATGLLEAFAALLGFAATSFFMPLLPALLAFSGGAMIYVVVEEMIPEMHHSREQAPSSQAFLLGFVVMMLLDVAFA